MSKTTVLFNKWIEHLQDMIYNYNNTSYRSAGVKSFILFKTLNPSAELYLQNLDINFDFNEYRLKYFYIYKNAKINIIEGNSEETSNMVY